MKEESETFDKEVARKNRVNYRWCRKSTTNLVFEPGNEKRKRTLDVGYLVFWGNRDGVKDGGREVGWI